MEDNGVLKNSGLSPDDDRMEALNRFHTASSVNMSPELFEKLYLSPPNQVRGQLRKTFGNPTPIGLLGFIISLSPLSCDQMGWRGAGGNGAATIGVYFFMGGIMLVAGGFLEWALGNSFISVVFFTFGTFWLSYGATLNPSFGAYSTYAPPDAASPEAGLETQGYNASLGYWFLFMALACLLFLICSLRTNISFVIIFLALFIGFCLQVGGFWAQAEDYVGNAAVANRCFVGAGASNFAAAMVGWYVLFAIMLENVDFPIRLPVGDLSTVVKGRSSRAKVRDD